MIPLRDNIPSRTVPIVNYCIMAVCGAVFLLQLAEERQRSVLVERYGMIPARVLHPDKPLVIRESRLARNQFGEPVELVQEYLAAEPPFPAWMTVITCMFLHGGWLHILGNLWFLYIFGDNVEDRFGHIAYLAFYLTCGIAAGLLHLATNASSQMPTIGASGAIAGVMGAYLLLYPRAMVLTLVPLFLFVQVVVLPAPIFLVIWFVIQLFQGVTSVVGAQAAGVAWWAHIGGFATGAFLARKLGGAGWLRPRVEVVLPQTQGPGYYRYRSRWL